MKKHLAFIMAAALTFSAVPAFSASAADEVEKKDFVLFGDSIAAGVSRDGKGVEHNYGEILADYYNGTVSNFAVSGDDSDQMLDHIKNLTDEQKKAVQDAEYVVISIGGNDIVYYVCKDILEYCAEKNLLNDGYTIDNLPKKPSLGELQKMLKIEGSGGLREYAKDMNNALDLVTTLTASSKQLRYDRPDKGFEGYIKNHIMKNISEAVSQIKAINPNAEVIVQNIYQPLQIDKNFISKQFPGTIGTAIGTLRQLLEDVLSSSNSFKSELNALAASDGFKVADVYTDFTSQEEGVMKSADAPGHASYFVDIATDDIKNNADIHPNQKGHLAIAAAIINTIGEKHNDGGLFSDIYENLSDKASYPAVALANYESAAGTWTKGDVNFDGVIDARDASAVLTGYAISSSANGDPNGGMTYRQRLASEVNSDGVRDARDATAILSYYAKASAGKAGSFEEFLKK